LTNWNKNILNVKASSHSVCVRCCSEKYKFNW